MTTVKFRASRSPMTFVTLALGFAILLLPVVILILDPPGPEFFELNWYAIFPIAIFGFFTYVLIASSLKMLTTFSISEDGISVYIPPFHSRQFKISEIKQVKLLSQEETKKIIEASILEQNSYSESADVVGYLRMIRKRSPAFRYFTIAPRARVTTVGAKETITSLHVKPTGGCITLTLNNGEVFFLTPNDPDLFQKTFSEKHPQISQTQVE